MRVAVLPLALALVASSSPARADDAEKAARLRTSANREIVQLNFEGAITLLEQAEATGANDPEAMTAIYRSLAESHAAIGHADLAEQSFRRLLALSPSAALPEGTSPKLTGPFEAARAFMKGRRPLTIQCARRADRAQVVVAADPISMVSAARLVTESGAPVDRSAPVEGSGRFAVPIPADAPTGLACAALDRHGNQLVRTPLPADVARMEATAERETGPAEGATGGSSALVTETAPDRDTSQPIYTRFWLWGGAALVAGGVGIYFAGKVAEDEEELRTINENSEQHTYEEALEVAERGQSRARYANIAIGTSGVLAAVSVGLLVRDLLRDRGGETAASTRRRGSRLGAAPMPGGAALTWSTSF